MVAGGDGLGRWSGLPVFVPRSAPGDRLRVRLTERRGDYARAEVVEVLEPGPGRRTPPCPVFDRCGGCDLQHLDESKQLSWKSLAVLETLERLAGLGSLPTPEILAGAPWAYRVKAQLHTETDAEGVARVGCYERGSHRLVPVERCPVLVPELEELLPTLAARPSSPSAPLPKRIDLAAGSGAATVAPAIAGLPQGEVSTTFGGMSLSYDARTFFQGHRTLLPIFVERAVGAWQGEQAVDLYAGVGLFSLALRRRYREVVAVESDAGAVRYLKLNAKRNKLADIRIVPRSVDSWIRELPAGVERVLVDPPRAGLGLAVRRVLADRRPRRLTYVSCHPATLARDLREFAASHRVESLALIDLFPQTGHMEVVVQLVAR